LFQQRLLSRISISAALVCLAGISSPAFAVAPTVSLTAPAANARYASPASITLTANASNTGDTISKVEFYQGATLLGTATTAPYTYSWTNVATGSYSLTAKATNSHNEVKTSTAVAVVVNNAPTVSLTAPAANTSVPGKASITLTADASDADGTISKVEFYNGTTLLNSDTTAPYSYNWNNVAPGTYSITAKATDNLSGTTTSTPVSITVTNPITVSISAPANNASVTVGTPIAITATAADSKGTISKVEFYNGTTLLGSKTTSPYTYSWTNAAAGTYSLTAKVTDSQSLTQTSTPVSVQVKASTNVSPTVSLTAPANNSSVAGKASISLTATATDTDGTVSKVEFYNGTTLLGSSTTAPYSYNWANVVPGSYSITAKVTDDKGGSTTSTPVSITVTNPITVNVTAPANNASVTVGTPIAITATATDSKGTITKVEFYNGATLLGSSTTAPYSYSWTNAAIGTYSITAKVTDSQSLTQTSSPVSVQVKAAPTTPPTVSLTPALKQSTQTAPANGTFVAPAGISLTATATAVSGSTISKVEFYQGVTLIATANAPTVANGNNYSVNWTNVTANSYNITAKATDNNNATATAAPIAVNIINNTAPVISLTASPQNATAPATIILNATATDTDGTITQVEFLNGTNSIATVTQAPYKTNWENVAQGSYNLTAKATDNLGATTTSAVVPVAVTASAPKVYDIHTDQIDTPRVITDPSGNEVWRWDSAPFGETLPNEQPTQATAKFVFNLRFAGQQYDVETGLHYNYFRDYDPQAGRYVESDPIGLDGGINTYGYVNGRPVQYIDPLGLCENCIAGQKNHTNGNGGSAYRYDRNDVRGGFTRQGDSAVYHPSNYNPRTASQIIIVGVASAGVGIWGAEAIVAGSTGMVTSWAPKGVTPDLGPGRWVMPGEATWWNYIRTFTWGPKWTKGRGFHWEPPPFGNCITGPGTPKWPNGSESWKGFFGQRKI